MHLRNLGLLLSLFAFLTVQGQSRNKQYEDYIKKYRDIAVEEMKRYHIPASITLAQGLLESGAGYGTLARKSNNHFGIKCGSDWRGKTVKHDDDARNECFRVYKDPKDSYRDHSKFLAGKQRYAFLFDLKITDYKGWARGLKKAGYATNPRYAHQLIDIIQRYNLDKYDKKGGLKWMNLILPMDFFISLLVRVIRGKTFRRNLTSANASFASTMTCIKAMNYRKAISFIWKRRTARHRKECMCTCCVMVSPCIPFRKSMASA